MMIVKRVYIEHLTLADKMIRVRYVRVIRKDGKTNKVELDRVTVELESGGTVVKYTSTSCDEILFVVRCYENYYIN